MIYDTQYKQRVIDFLKEGHTQKEASLIFKVGTTTIKRWLKQWKTYGNLEKKPLNRKFKKIDPEMLKEYVEKHPDAYLKEMAKEFNCCTAAIYFVLQKLKITLKKRSKFIKKEMKIGELNSQRKHIKSADQS